MLNKLDEIKRKATLSHELDKAIIDKDLNKALLLNKALTPLVKGKG